MKKTKAPVEKSETSIKVAIADTCVKDEQQKEAGSWLWDVN